MGKEWLVGKSGSSVGLLYIVTETLFWEQKNMAPHKGLKNSDSPPKFYFSSAISRYFT